MKQSTKKKLLYNTIISLFLQVTSVVCGFILPRLILGEYGSNANGLVQAITRFLSVISFLELGVGYVIQSELYKPLAENDKIRLSEIVVSGGKYFKQIGNILIVYVGALVVLFPLLHKSDFSWIYSATLILAISISYFAQYYFGIIDRLLLNSDQRGYIQYSAQIITLILNTVLSIILIKAKASIQLVKLVSSIVFFIRPLLLRVYVNRNYSIDRKIVIKGEPIKQKWNGIAVHISSTILDETDTIVLTLFSTLANVSIYSVYHLVVYGVKQIVFSLTSGIDAIFGRLWAKGEKENLLRFFSLSEWAIHLLSVYIFSCAGILIIPFIRVYTNGVTDANYIQPAFAIIIVAAHAGHCLRLPYNKLILAAGKFKETQKCHIMAAVLNMFISCITVYLWGLIGVAIGTLIAMYYQTIWMAIYCSKHLVNIEISHFLKQIIADCLSVTFVILSSSWVKMSDISYLNWIKCAFMVAFISALVAIIINYFLYRNNLSYIIREIRKRRANNKMGGYHK